MTIAEVYRNAVERLQTAGVEEAALEVTVLLGHVLRLNRVELFLALQQSLSPLQQEQFERLLARRLGREPLAYILGEKEFWSLVFRVSPSVLIPRPETELLIERVLETGRESGGFPGELILDLGTGTGIIPVVLALELPKSRICAVDLSRAALTIAAANVHRHAVQDRIMLINAHWLQAFQSRPMFGLLLSNPPYINSSALASLEPEVRCFEPRLALDGGVDGMIAIDEILLGAASVLLPGGWLFMEIGSDQGDSLRSRLQAHDCFEDAVIHSDYAGHDRLLQVRKRVSG